MRPISSFIIPLAPILATFVATACTNATTATNASDSSSKAPVVDQLPNDWSAEERTALISQCTYAAIIKTGKDDADGEFRKYCACEADRMVIPRYTKATYALVRLAYAQWTGGMPHEDRRYIVARDAMWSFERARAETCKGAPWYR